MRAHGPLLTFLTFVAALALGYVTYAVSASVHPGAGAPTTSARPIVRPLERDSRDR
jgi:hypothetical protein